MPGIIASKCLHIRPEFNIDEDICVFHSILVVAFLICVEFLGTHRQGDFVQGLLR